MLTVAYAFERGNPFAYLIVELLAIFIIWSIVVSIYMLWTNRHS